MQNQNSILKKLLLTVQNSSFIFRPFSTIYGWARISKAPLMQREFIISQNLCEWITNQAFPKYVLLQPFLIQVKFKESHSEPGKSGLENRKYIIVRTLKNDRGVLAGFFTEQSEVEKPKMLSGGEAVAQHFEFVKRAKRAFTNWPKPEVVLKGPDNVFCHVRKLPPDKFQMRPFGRGNCYPRT